MSNQDKDKKQASDLKRAAQALTKQALGNRDVSEEAWAAARKVADLAVLQIREAGAVVIDALPTALNQGLWNAGYQLVRREDIAELISTGESFGLAKRFPTDSVKLKALKDAFDKIRWSGMTASVPWGRVVNEALTKNPASEKSTST